MEVLVEHKQVWDQKKILRDIYQDWYKMIMQDLYPSTKPTLEIGAGTGNFKDFNHNVIASDIIPCDWVDACFDAHRIPFKNQTFANIVLIDVLHHLSSPFVFFEETIRVLEPGGKVVLLEPYPSLFSRPVYKAFHPEPFLYDVDYFSKKSFTEEKDPWDANQAMAFSLFFKNGNRFNEVFSR